MMSLKMDDLLIFFLLGSFVLLGVRLIFVMCFHERITFLPLDFKSAGGGKLSIVYIIAAIVIGIYMISVIPDFTNPACGIGEKKHFGLWNTRVGLVYNVLFREVEGTITPTGVAESLASEGLLNDNMFNKALAYTENHLCSNINDAIDQNELNVYLDRYSDITEDYDPVSHLMYTAGFTFNSAMAETQAVSAILDKVMFFEEISVLMEVFSIASLMLFIVLLVCSFSSSLYVMISWYFRVHRNKTVIKDMTSFIYQSKFATEFAIRFGVGSVSLLLLYCLGMWASQASMNNCIRVAINSLTLTVY